MKRLAIFLVILLLAAVTALAGPYDPYKMAHNERNWDTKYNGALDALGTLYGLVTTWAGTELVPVMEGGAPTYVNGASFTLAGDATSRYTAGKVIECWCGSDGLKITTVASSSYAVPTTTVNLAASVLTANLVWVRLTGSRDGLWPHGPGYIVAADYGTSQAALAQADAVAASAGKLLVISQSYTIFTDMTLSSAVLLLPGAILTRSGGTHLTISGTFQGSPGCIADNTAGHNWLVLGAGAIDMLRSSWFINGDTSAQVLYSAGGISLWLKADNTLACQAWPRSDRVYCLGDSFTCSDYYEAQLRTLLGANWQVINLGISSQTIAQIAARLNGSVINPGDAKYLVIWGGVNSITADVSAADIEANLQSIYTAAHNAGIKVVALTISPFKGNIDWTSARQTVLNAVNTWLKNTASNIDYLLDVYPLLVDPGNADSLLAAYDSGDHKHLSLAGYNLVGSAIYAGTVWTGTTTQYATKISHNAALNQDVSSSGSPIFTALGIGRLATAPLDVYGPGMVQCYATGSDPYSAGGFAAWNDAGKHGHFSMLGSAFATATEQNSLWILNYNGTDIHLGWGGYYAALSILTGAGASQGNVGIGTETPTSKLQVVGLPIYANNTAALAGGLTAGAFYRTGANPDPVCVVH